MNGNSIESDKCVKLSKVVNTKSKEISEVKTENKSLKEKNDELTKKCNETSTKVTALEIKNTRLETQIEHLIEAVGKRDNSSQDEDFQPTATSRMDALSPKMTKCRHNDKAICLRKETCHYIHHNLVCNAFSKYGRCEKEETCPKRHPLEYTTDGNEVTVIEALNASTNIL